jgi:aromatic ring hydroxylase
MRTGAEYRDALRDGRKVWVLGEGRIEDVTVHPATRSVVEEYVAWYDRHFDPEWQDTLLTPPNAKGERSPWGYVLPKSAEGLRRMGQSFSATTFLSAGNLTHTPAYGQLIALGVLFASQEHDVSAKQVNDAAAYRDLIADTGRFLTFSAGAATIGYRMRADPNERTALKIVRETDAGLVIRGKIGMHTSPAYAEDVYVGAHSGVDLDGHRVTLVVPVGAPGVTTICRKIAVRDANPFVAPLSSRYDELDGQMWLDDVFIPWERVFLLDHCQARRWSWLLQTVISLSPNWQLGSKSRSAAAATPPCSARLFYKWRGTMSLRRLMAASRPLNSMPMAVCPRGVAVCGAASTAIMSWQTPCCARSTWRCQRST